MDSDTVTFEEVELRALPDGAQGCFLWQSSCDMARWVSAHPKLFKDLNVIELGSGLGLVGLCAAKIAKQTTLTDYIPQVIESLEYNRRLNSNTASRVSVSPLDWSRVAQLDASDRYDVLIGADLLYSGYNVVPDLFDITSEISENGIDHGNFVQIAKVIDCVLSGKGNAHLFCRVRENEEEFDYFYEELASLGFQTDVRAVDVQVCSAAVDAKEYPFVVKHIHAYRQSSLDP